MYRIKDLRARNKEVALPKEVTDEVANVLAAYSAELEIGEKDPDYRLLTSFSLDVTQAVIAALARMANHAK